MTEAEITVRCMECNRLIRSGKILDEHISHGYCEECYQYAMKEIKESLEEIRRLANGRKK